MATLPSALAGFANMFGVGTVYAASTFQEQLPRLLGISQQSSYAPFALACLGLSIGVALCGSMLYRTNTGVVIARGTILWGVAVTCAGLS
ncbi:hypothetical protein N7449_004351 [Penicillium cf. viridicatum]|uniref:Uncharacterized protein n=1 Tax=Penicillium cf. viridicatum TaxID=2972119 RepID=A0A9W9MJ69_9EURO|nr:hypothetical protein N7449_004351 [Penicillium cf. viridicatum]